MNNSTTKQHGKKRKMRSCWVLTRCDINEYSEIWKYGLENYMHQEFGSDLDTCLSNMLKYEEKEEIERQIKIYMQSEWSSDLEEANERQNPEDHRQSILSLTLESPCYVDYKRDREYYLKRITYR